MINIYIKNNTKLITHKNSKPKTQTQVPSHKQSTLNHLN